MLCKNRISVSVLLLLSTLVFAQCFTKTRNNPLGGADAGGDARDMGAGNSAETRTGDVSLDGDPPRPEVAQSVDGAGGGDGSATSGDGATGGSATDGGGATGGSATGGRGTTGGGGTTGGTAVGGGGAMGGTATGGGAGGPGTGGVTGTTGAENGAKCLTGTECKSNQCFDGVCCDLKCDGTCETCSTGKCVFTTAPRKPCAGSGKCAGACDKSNQKECTFDKTTVCATQSCTAGERLNKSICDGKGTCPAQDKTTCDPKQCAADGTDCATCTDEPLATTCAGGRCGATLNNCGHTVNCPASCSGTGETCAGGGKAGFCGCTSASAAQTCGTSNCDTKIDNCGKTVSCGNCGTGSTCASGQCCTPSCSGKCGVSDGCGGTCPASCPSGQTCNNGACCTPSCSGRCGGNNGCGGTCPATCPSGQTCNSGACCTPDCTNKCGVSDGCGGTCSSTCSSGICYNGTCCVGNNNACSGRGCGTAVNNCGTTISCGTCGSSTPACVSGICKECSAPSDCPLHFFACINNACACRQPKANNKLAYPGFDSSLTGWTATNVTWNSDDSDSCPRSGSASFAGSGASLEQCFRQAKGSTVYNLGFKSIGEIYCVGGYYEEPNCTSLKGPEFMHAGMGSSSDSWTPIPTGSYESPSWVQSIKITCQGTGRMDQVYLNEVTFDGF